MYHHVNGRLDWSTSEHQSIYASREAISILSGKYKRYTFVHPVSGISKQKHLKMHDALPLEVIATIRVLEFLFIASSQNDSLVIRI